MECLPKRELQNLLGPWRERNVTRRRRTTLTNDFLDLAADRFERNAERLEGLGSNALTLMDETKKDVFGADVIVVE